MRYKEGVPSTGLHWRMRKALQVAKFIWESLGKELVVTATTDGEHCEWSWHYYGCAVDLRSRDFSRAEAQAAVRNLRNQLPDGYQVIVHATHVHIEYDHELVDGGGS